MPFAIGATLMVLGPLLAVVLAVAVPFIIGLIAYDLWALKKTAPVVSSVSEAEAVREELEAAGRRIQVERGVARAFVILGGAFWGIAAFAGLYWFQETGVGAAAMAAGVPLFASLVTLVIGWYWERIASLMLTAATVGVLYWGITIQFEAGVWMLVTIALIGPMMTAAVLFWLARREYEALVIRLNQPELVLATAKESSY